MKYHGRVVQIGFIWLLFGLNYFYLQTHNFKMRMDIMVIVLALLTMVAWWLGGRYDRLKYYSLRDDLTLTYNRRYVYSNFPKMKNQADRRGHKLHVYVIDINDFKKVNDNKGHAAGDLVLRSIAQSLKQVSHSGEVIARWGGDEFIAITTQAANDSRSLDPEVIELGLRELAEGLGINVTVSIGKATYPDDARSLERLLKIADSKMYEIKQNTRKNIFHSVHD